MGKANSLQLLRYRRAQMAAVKKLPNRGKKLPRWLPPISIEKEYQRLLVKHINSIYANVKQTINPFLELLLLERNANINLDGWPEEAQQLLGLIETSTGEKVARLAVQVKVIGEKTNVWNDRQWRKILRSAFGVDLFQREPWLNDTLASWNIENANLIKNLSDDYIADISGTVQRGISAGQSQKVIAKEIQERTGVSKSRARLIGRDQVSKLNGKLTELRQTNLGVEEYIWRSVDDASVRPTHAAHDDKKYRWDKVPANTGHPGSDYQCRCYAEPVFDELFDEIDQKEKPFTPDT